MQQKALRLTLVTDSSSNPLATLIEDKSQTLQPSEKGNTDQSQTITQSGPYGSISVTLPDGWTYRNCEVE